MKEVVLQLPIAPPPPPNIELLFRARWHHMHRLILVLWSGVMILFGRFCYIRQCHTGSKTFALLSQKPFNLHTKIKNFICLASQVNLSALALYSASSSSMNNKERTAVHYVDLHACNYNPGELLNRNSSFFLTLQTWHCLWYTEGANFENYMLPQKQMAHRIKTPSSKS